jgi:hypothetical protein
MPCSLFHLFAKFTKGEGRTLIKQTVSISFNFCALLSICIIFALMAVNTTCYDTYKN